MQEKSKSVNDFVVVNNSLIWLPIKDFWCDIINGDLACWATPPMSPLGNNVTLGLQPRATLLPLGDIGRVALQVSHHLITLQLSIINVLINQDTGYGQ